MNLTEVGEAGLSSSDSVYLKRFYSLEYLSTRVAQIGGTWERRSEEVEDRERKWEEMGGRREGEREMPELCFVLYFFVAKC